MNLYLVTFDERKAFLKEGLEVMGVTALEKWIFAVPEAKDIGKWLNLSERLEITLLGKAEASVPQGIVMHEKVR